MSLVSVRLYLLAVTLRSSLLDSVQVVPRWNHTRQIRYSHIPMGVDRRWCS